MSDPLQALVIDPTPEQRRMLDLQSRLGKAYVRQGQLESLVAYLRGRLSQRGAQVTELKQRERMLTTELGGEGLKRMQEWRRGNFYEQAAHELCEALLRPTPRRWWRRKR